MEAIVAKTKTMFALIRRPVIFDLQSSYSIIWYITTHLYNLEDNSNSSSSEPDDNDDDLDAESSDESDKSGILIIEEENNDKTANTNGESASNNR